MWWVQHTIKGVWEKAFTHVGEHNLGEEGAANALGDRGRVQK